MYSILSPEGYATILWKDASKAEEAAEVMRLTAEDLYDLKVIDKILKEPEGGAHKDVQNMAQTIKKEIEENIEQLQKKTIEDLLQDRYMKFRNMGEYELPK